MRSYTIYDLGMNVSGEKFILPIDGNTSDEEILKRTCELFRPYFKIDKKKNIEVDKNNVQIPCLYEGYDGYYSYEIALEVFHLKYDNHKRVYEGDKKDKKEVEEGQLMVALCVETGDELLRELIDIKVLPDVIEKTCLRKYTYIL